MTGKTTAIMKIRAAWSRCPECFLKRKPIRRDFNKKIYTVNSPENPVTVKSFYFFEVYLTILSANLTTQTRTIGLLTNWKECRKKRP